MLLTIPFLSLSVAADPTANIRIDVLGGFLVPKLMHFCGGTLINYDLSNTTYNVMYTITVTGKTNASYEGNYTHTGPEIPHLITIPNGTTGLGTVIVTINVTTSDGYTASKAAKGIQLGGFTWIPLSWSLPPVLKDYVPWLDYHTPNEK